MCSSDLEENPEMQKRAFNVIRALGEENINPILSIHDHGAGGHLNCLSELLEALHLCTDRISHPKLTSVIK